MASGLDHLLSQLIKGEFALHRDHLETNLSPISKAPKHGCIREPALLTLHASERPQIPFILPVTSFKGTPRWEMYILYYSKKPCPHSLPGFIAYKGSTSTFLQLSVKSSRYALFFQQTVYILISWPICYFTYYSRDTQSLCSIQGCLQVRYLQKPTKNKVLARHDSKLV